MDAKTTINSLMRGIDNILVPAYQRAYSWEKKQLDQFIKDLEDYHASIPYYFGHFLFEKTDGENYKIIDGQQRLTTIIIFLNACFFRIKKERRLTDEEQLQYEDMIKRGERYKFTTVEYDRLFFNDYVINQTLKNRNNLDTNSKVRIANASDFFSKYLRQKKVHDISAFISAISNSICTTHIVTTESEAVQMFIFQNDRGKKPTKLEVIKARFMYKIHVNVLEKSEKEAYITEIEERFKKIYKASSKIDERIDEDDVLLYSLRIYFNSLRIDVSTEKIEQELQKETAIKFIQEFSQELESSFDCLQKFFGEKQIYKVYSFALLGGSVLLPFVIKAYKYNVSDKDMSNLCSSLESLLLRHRIISTRAHLEDRVSEVYEKFTSDNPNIEKIVEWNNDIFKCDDSEWWWSHWNNNKFENALQGKIDFNLVKHLLWRYENHLNEESSQGYSFMLYEQVKSPEVEHIAPQTPTDNAPIAAGYCKYTDDFREKYLDCIGNYLLISKSHNCRIGNEPFKDKLSSYKTLNQQREIIEFVDNTDNPKWGIKQIKNRRRKIVNYILENF